MSAPKEYVAVGQSYEDDQGHDTLFTITHVEQALSSERCHWQVTLLCVISSWHWFRPGGTTLLVSSDGTLDRFGYRRLA